MITALLVLLLQTDAEVDRAIEAYAKSFKAATNADGRAAAVGQLGGAQHPRLLERIVAITASREPAMRAAAASLLGNYRQSKSAGDALALLAADTDPTVTVMALQTMGNMAREISRSHAEVLTKRFGDKDDAVVRAAILATGVVRAKQSIEPLIDAEAFVAQKIVGIFLSMGVDGCDGG